MARKKSGPKVTAPPGQPRKGEADYIAMKRFDYDIKKLLQKYPDGAPNHIIAQALEITEEEVQEIYEGLVYKLREFMLVDQPLEDPSEYPEDEFAED